VSLVNKVDYFVGFIEEFSYFCNIKTTIMKKLLIFCATLFGLSIADAKITMPQLFQSGMVLQRGKTIPVWGKADAEETVTLRFNKKEYQTIADTNGRWQINLPKMKAGGPYQMSINDLTFEDILIGDVWLCSGQSNIDVTIERVYPQYTQEIDNYENSQIRMFRVQNETSTQGVKEDIRPTDINWKPVNKQNAWLFSAVGYFLGKQMFEKHHVPQGIIVNSWGGTPIEAWISEDSLVTDYPMLIKRTKMYRSDYYVRAQMHANFEANRQWESLLNEYDPGYAEVSVDDTLWPNINQESWTWRGVGSVWLRQHINIDKEHAGKPARLLLGTLFDQDYTYLNGKQIGHTGYQYPPRRYDIPEGLLREGDNVIAVRFINKYGAAHFIPEKPYMLCFGEDRLSQNPMPKDVVKLSGLWKMHVGAEMPQCPSSDVSLQNLPTTLYNAVLYPLAPYAINGVVWYQGESNTGNPAPYADYLKKLMGNWRNLWQNQQMPFVIVQLANYDGRQQSGFPRPLTPQTEPMNSGWAQLREAQRKAAKADEKAELAVINDLGERIDIHPLRKKEVAERVSACFEKLLYNNKVKLSPEVIACELVGDKVLLTLDQKVNAGRMCTFEVAADDGRYHNVESNAEGNKISLSLGKLSSRHPKSVRYAWKDNPEEANVRSLTGWPMSSFEITIKQ